MNRGCRNWLDLLRQNIGVDDDHRRLPKFRWLADRLSWRDFQLDATQRLDNGTSRLRKVPWHRSRLGCAAREGREQNIARLSFQRMSMLRCARFEPTLQVFVDVRYCDAVHVGPKLHPVWSIR